MGVYKYCICCMENIGPKNTGAVYNDDLRLVFGQEILADRAIGVVNADYPGGKGFGAFEAIAPADLADASFAKITQDGPD